MSGKRFLAFAANVDVGALNGNMGSQLLGPDNITISDRSGGAADGSLISPPVNFDATNTGGAVFSETALAILR